MRTLRAWALRLRGLFHSSKDEREFDEQVQADIDLHIEDCIRAGMPPEEARRLALLKFGSVVAAKEEWRERRGIPFLETLIRDVAHAFRMLGRNKGWTAVAIGSLALGIGANTTIFSAANALLLRKLPVPHAEELVTLRWEGENKAWTGFNDYGFVPGGIMPDDWFGGGEFSFSGMRGGVTGAFATFRRLEEANKTLTHLFAVGPGPTVNVIVDGQGDTASSQFISGDYFAAVGIPSAAGRAILPTDDKKGAAPVAVMSHPYWQRRFNSDPAIVGKRIRINNAAFTIVGVSGPGLPDIARTEPASPDLSIPLANEPLFQHGESRLAQTTNWWLVMMGRLKPGATPVQVEANLGPVYEKTTRNAIVSFLAALPPEDQQEAKGYGFGEKIPHLHVVSGSRGPYDPMPMLRTPLAILGVLVGIVLLVVCVNLGNLSLALTTSREREIAVRRAIGATPRRLIRQLLTEHLVVALLGGVVSLLVAYGFQGLIREYFTADFDLTTVLIAFVIAAVTGFVIGILPAVRAARVPGALPTGGGSIRRSRLASGLLVTQVVMSLVLLVGAGLFLRTLFNLRNVNPGFDTGHLVLFRLDPQFNEYDEPKTKALYDRLMANLGALPGVSSVSFSSQALLDGNVSQKYVYAEGNKAKNETTYSMVVHPDFFKTMGIALRVGRTYDARDGAESKTAVINEALARALFGETNPVGRRFGTSTDKEASSEREAPDFEVIGVVADTRHRSLRAGTEQMFFIAQAQSTGGSRTFEVRTSLPPEELMLAIRGVVHDADPALPILALATQTATMETQWAQERIIAMAAATLGGLTLVVSMIGLFGLMSYAVARRTRDIAIRMALGAERATVLRSILGEALILVGIGTAIGLGVALATTGLLKSRLFGLAPHDPLVLGAAAVVMLIVAAIAGYLPARRAASVDPMVALRQE